MDTLRANIINIYGEAGKKWLLDLNQIVKTLQKYWNLKEIKAVNNLTYNYVAKALNDKNNHVILKVGIDKKIINDEVNALKYFNNNGSIGILDYSQEYNAILLEQAIPGITLKSLYPHELDFVMDNFLLTISKLLDHSLPDKNNFPSISSWLESIDKIKSNVIPKKLVDKAITLKASLLSSIKNEKLLHGSHYKR